MQGAMGWVVYKSFFPLSLDYPTFERWELNSPINIPTPSNAESDAKLHLKST